MEAFPFCDKNCTNKAKFYYQSKASYVMLCEEHTHLHKKQTLIKFITPLDPSETKAFEQSLNLLKTAMELQISEIRKEQQAKFASLAKIIASTHQKFSDLMQNLTANYFEVDSILSNITVLQGLPVFTENSIISTLLSTKQQGTISLRSILGILKDYEFRIELPEPEEEQKFPEVFIHSLYIGDTKLQILDETTRTREFEKQNIGNSSSSLALDPNTLLITGRWHYNRTINKQVFELDTRKGGLTKMASLIIGRGFHSMTWVAGNPAVIGGKDSTEKKLASVEIYHNDSWQKFQPLNIPRDNHTACCATGGSFVFGGYINDETGKTIMTDTIEKYAEGVWRVLNVILPVRSARLGAFAKDTRTFLLVGGIGDDYLPRKDVWVWTEDGINDAKKLAVACSFEQNLWVIKDGRISGFERTGKVVSYRLT